MAAPAIRHVILDRDGVLNREAAGGDCVREPSQFEWLPGALEALAMLKARGVYVSVVTNQSGVGRGRMTLVQLAAVHEHMQAQAAAHDAALDAVFFCPHAPEERCDCRKPAPRLIRDAVAHSGIAARESLAVGDDQRDLDAARQAGVAAALVRTGKGRQTEALLREAGARTSAVAIYDDLLELARAVVAADGAPGVAARARQPQGSTS
jgi:D-glycero-D-manno-heptose 1,7-bisphosphate phosphatase